MADIDLKTSTPDTTLPTTGFLFGADSQAASAPSVYSTQAVATTLLGSTTLSGATITASQPVLDLSQTWNNGATTFTGLKFNVADNASAAASLLMDLQVGGSSRFSVSKTGSIRGYAADLNINPSDSGYPVNLNNNMLVYGTGGGFLVQLNAAAPFRFGSDLILTRRGAANLRLGAADAAAPVAQTLSVQSVVAGTTNTAGANLTITGSQGTGTGAGGSIVFQVAPAGSSGTAQNALATALTIDSTKLATFEGRVASRFGYTFGSPQFYDASLGSGAGFGILNAQTSVMYGGSTAVAAFEDGSNGIRLAGARSLGWVDGHAIQGVADVRLWRDAANTLALRNGANAQLLRVYARYDGTNDAYGAMGAAVNLDGTAGDANTLYVGSQKKGSPTALTKLAVQVDGTTRLDYNISNANQWFINGTFQSGGSFFSGGDVRAAVTGSIYWNGRTNITAPADGNLLIGNLAQTDFGRMMFGGTTSSFPAIKRSSTTLQVRLADDSAFASVQGKITTDTAYTAGDPTTTGYLVVYDSTGTAYKIPAVAV